MDIKLSRYQRRQQVHSMMPAQQLVLRQNPLRQLLLLQKTRVEQADGCCLDFGA